MSSDAGVEQPTGEILNLLQEIEQVQPLQITDNNQEQNNEVHTPVESKTSDCSDLEGQIPYEIQDEQPGPQLECTHYTKERNDREINCAVTSGWVRLDEDTGSFIDITMQNGTSGDFFDEVVDIMWTLISENTNTYVKENLASGNKGDLIQHL